MGQPRPRLLIVGGPSVPAEVLREQLGERFDVTVGDASTAAVSPRDLGFQALLTDAEAIPAPEISKVRALTLLNAIGEGVCLAAPSGDVLWANDFYNGLPESIRARIAGACHEASGAFVRLGAAVGSEARPQVRFEFADDGAHRTFEVVVSQAPVLGAVPVGAGGDPVAVVVREITSARRLQQKMDAIDKAGEELIALEAEEVRKLNAVERLRLMEAKVIRHARELLRFDHFVIRLIDDKSRRLETVITCGLPQDIADLTLYSEEEGSGISGFVAATGRSYVCRDVNKDEKFLPGLEGARSSLTVPLRLGEDVIGIMDIESAESDAFDDEDRMFAEMFARHVAVALHLLDLLVAERSITNESVSGRVQGEIAEPLDDIMKEAARLEEAAAMDPESARHLSRIRADVEAIRRRMTDMAAGPQTLLGVERALAERTRDPVMAGRRVLVADDAIKIRRIIGDVLRNRGCDVTVVENGQLAIDAIEAVGRGERAGFDLVVSDIKMPDRNGYEVFAAARRTMPDVSVVLMTGFGYDPHHSIVRASQEGLQAVLFKPFQIERLVDEVRKALAARPVAAEKK